MGVFRQFPYSNFHEMNMDEIIKIIKNMLEEWAQYHAEWDAWMNEINDDWSNYQEVMNEAWQNMQDFINNYFNNLDVQNEINNKITSMVNTGEFATIVEPYIPPRVTAWLAEHITEPVGVVIDTSLTVEGACADAKATGDAINNLQNTVEHLVEYEVEHITSGTGAVITEDIPFNFIEGGYYKITVELSNPLANVKLQLRDKINNPLINDTVYNSSYVGVITFKAEHSGKYLRYTSTSNATITITAVTISYNYENEETDIANITSHILFDAPIPLIENKVIYNNTSIVDPTLVTNLNAKCCIVPCNLGDIYVITGTGIGANTQLYAFTDTQYHLITNSNTTVSNLQIQAPSNGYLICNFYKEVAHSLIKKKSKYIDVRLDELETEVDNLKTDVLPPFSGIDMFGKIACLGDSFTVGGVRNSTDSGWLSARNSYPAVLHNRHSIPVTNFGASGSTTKTYYENNIQTVLNAEAHDVYFLCWGLNDAWNSMPIGSASDIHEDYTTNPDTYFGNYGKIIATLRNEFPMARFVLITPWRNVAPFNAYQEPSIEIAETMGIAYIDTRTDAFFTSDLWNNTLVASHPTQVTYTGMAYAVERLMEKCIVNNELYFRYAGIENEVPIDYD